MHVYRGRPVLHPPTICDRDTDAVTFALAMVRTAVFAQIQFDEQLAFDFNDIDLCLQARELGWSIAYCASSIHFHLETLTRRKYGDHNNIDNKRHFMTKWRHRVAGSPSVEAISRL